MLRIILGQGASALRVPVHASGMPIVHGRNISFRMSSSSSSRVVSSLSTSPLSLVSKSNQHGIFVATTPSSWLQAHAASFQMNHRQSTSMTKRFFSAAAAGGGGGDAKSSANKSGGEQEQQKKKPKEEGAEAEAEEEVYDANEPMVARVSRILWTTIKLGFGMGLVGVIMYAGYTIITTLLPLGASSNAIMRKASDIVLADPEVHNAFGVAKTYGLDPGGRAEGRRYFVPEYKYEDTISGEQYHRVKFNLEGERGKKAWVYAEVTANTYEFRYLLVVAKDGSRVVSIIDHRPPAMSADDRRARVTSLLAGADWGFYVDNEIDAKEQAKPLGNYWLKVKCIRCDEQPARCEAAGVTSTPAWKTDEGIVKGLKTLDDLEKMVQPIAREQEGKGKKKGLFSFLS